VVNRQGMVALLKRRGIRDERVLQAMAIVPRQAFVPESSPEGAYGDHALPIGHRQTISQPYIVALMTEALELQAGDRVLEIGTGSGYQAAVLAELGMDVYTVERIAELHEVAVQNLEELGYAVHAKVEDGYRGWNEHAPFDGIIVTAAASEIPEPLIAQLADGGRMVIPVGPAGGYQTLWKVIRKGDEIQRVNLGGVAFVPFISGEME
jgi:protein-L-isoaspartate(D-aspartate) O-methyltransferase